MATTRMQRDINRMASQAYDVLVIGGGINGAGIARDLALRGVRVALVEKADFASGTSSASTKLIHGGLRYLEQFNLKLVFESCRERRILQRIAPHLVRPLPFFIPVYRGDKRPLWMVRAGLALYDLLALFRNTHHHELLSTADALKREPTLKPEGLKGVLVYWDCRMDDARLCLENVISAAEAGADVANYAEVTGLLQADGAIVGARVVDAEDGREYAISARIVVNATGPWLDRVRRLDADCAPVLRTTRGTHIVVPRVNAGDEAIYLASGRDDRLFFVVPWGEQSLIGTTDVDFTAAADAVEPTEADITYLLEESARHLQEAGLSRDSVVAAFAGLRPLVRDTGSAEASRVSREHTILRSRSGLISVAGGKYTTYRAVAEQVARMVSRSLGRPAGRSRTGQLPLPGAAGDSAALLRGSLPSGAAISDAQLRLWQERYGRRVETLLAAAAAQPDLLQPVVAGSRLTRLEVDYAVRHEMARTPADVLRRRTGLALGPGQGLDELPAVAELMRQLLGADPQSMQRWDEHYRTHEAWIKERDDDH